MQAAEIRLSGVTAGYDGRAQIRDVSLELGSGDFAGVTGPNGGGKTTLARVMLGLLKPMAGTVSYRRDGREVERLRMGYLPQYSAIDKDFPISVGQTVMSGLNSEAGLWGRLPGQLRERAAETMREMGLEDMERRQIKALSGGELQRVLLARAMVSRPEALILDEPDTYIDDRSERLMHDTLQRISRNCCIVMVSHDLQLVESLANVMVNVDETVSVTRL